jgi:hypothetical protein
MRFIRALRSLPLQCLSSEWHQVTDEAPSRLARSWFSPASVYRDASPCRSGSRWSSCRKLSLPTLPQRKLH